MSDLNLDQLLDEGKRVYVVNNSNPRGTLVISLIHPSTGNVTPITIPVTWVPVCVTDIVPREQLRDSLDFRGYLRKGIIKLVDPKKAEAILKTKEAKEELNRLNKSEFADDSPMNLSPKPETAGDETQVQINPKVMDIILRLESKDITTTTALNMIKSLYTTLSRQDLSYIATNTTAETIRQWAEKALASSE